VNEKEIRAAVGGNFGEDLINGGRNDGIGGCVIQGKFQQGRKKKGGRDTPQSWHIERSALGGGGMKKEAKGEKLKERVWIMRMKIHRKLVFEAGMGEETASTVRV